MGRWPLPCLLWGGLDKYRHIVYIALLVRMHCSRKALYMTVEGQNTRPIVLSMITRSYFRRWRRLIIFETGETGETKRAAPFTLLNLYLDHRRIPQKQILEAMYVLLITRLLRLVGRWARKPVNHTSWVAVVTPTDRPKSVRNRCVIELFCGVVYVVTLPFWHFCWCMGFCHRTESDIFLFLFIKFGQKPRVWHEELFKCLSQLNWIFFLFDQHILTKLWLYSTRILDRRNQKWRQPVRGLPE